MALLFGSIIGIERKWRQRMAGLRTNALVATGLCLFILITPLVGSTGSRPVDGTEVISSYEIRAVCRQDVEERIRMTMITADVTISGRPNQRLEKIVTRLGVNPG